MSGPLNSIFAAVEPLLLANMTYLGVAGTTFGHIGLERVQEASTPRVSWVPIKEDYQPPRGLGGDVMAVGVTQPLYTRVVDVEVDVWGADRDTVESMINGVVSAVHDALSQGSYGIEGATWLLPEAAGKNGEICRITFKFLVPVVRVAPTTTTAIASTIPTTASPTFHVGS